MRGHLMVRLLRPELVSLFVGKQLASASFDATASVWVNQDWGTHSLAAFLY